MFLSLSGIKFCSLETFFLEGFIRDREGTTGGNEMNELFFPAGIQILVPDSSRL